MIPEAAKPATPVAALAADEDDFFSTWNEPKKPSSGSSTPTSSSTPAPVVGLGSATSSPQRTGLIRPQRSTLTPKKTTLGASKPMRLGVKKVGGANFEEAEARAKAEAERIATLGAEAAEQERLEKKATADRALQRAADLQNASKQPQAAPVRTNYYQSNNAGSSASKASDEGLARLGMGMGRMGFGAAPSARSSNYSTPQGKNSGSYWPSGGAHGINMLHGVKANCPFFVQPLPPSLVEQTAAREKFGTQKAISSDQFFGRNNYDAKAQSEANTRLQSFSGATAISSSQYFGRDEEQPANDEGNLDCMDCTTWTRNHGWAELFVCI